MDPWRWAPLLLLLAALGLITVIFVPSLLELNNPMDNGPRQISEMSAENREEEKNLS